MKDDLLMQHDATCILMKRLIREQRIKTIRSGEQDQDSPARKKLELMLQKTEDQKEALEKEKQEMLLVFDILESLWHLCRDPGIIRRKVLEKI